ncbi:DUF4350 domain-containing protein [Microbacterium karelineae]|uniref:DUF4350 domain-containing protein n=1 Tax=Microbacterium karelineae TaxID=2654283 RepID=UPI0012EA6CA9|nr:DUF4350 domain-containing protein [Microbacterium karelineae]
MSLLATTESAERAPRGSRARRAWGWIAVIAAIVIVGSLIAVFERDWSAPDRFDADSPRYDGARAIATLLGEQGVAVEQLDRVADVRERIGSGATLAITDASILDVDVLRELAGAARSTVILDADFASMDVFFPGIGYGGSGSGAVAPDCGLPAASNAGAILPGTLYSSGDPAIAACYPAGEGYALLQADVDADSTLTLLDGEAILVNDALDQEGHAALALGLLGQADDLVWYTPTYADPEAADGAPVLGDFVPTWVTPAIILGAFVAAAAAVWRGRRFGPLVAETLPVTVRAGETLEGRARLYRAGGDPAHAMAALRRGARVRMSRRLGLPADADAAQLARGLGGVLNRDPQAVHAVLTSEPHDDAEFADAGARLRELEDALEDADPWEGRTR